MAGICGECEITEGTWYKVGQEMNVTSQLRLHITLQGEGLSPTHVSDCSDMGGSMAAPECYQLPDGSAIRSELDTPLNSVLTLLLFTARLFTEHRLSTQPQAALFRGHTN